MNRLIKFTKSFALLVLILGGSLVNKAGAQPMDDVSMQTFYDDLEPYGQWVDDPDYGYVWVPEVDDPDFRPYYTRGHWVMSEYGNMWVSDYDWGWAPFHYGRWAYTDFYGWVWIPGMEWGPAWVSWRSGGDYYGWAPMGPRVSIDIAIGGYSCPDFWWTFIPRRHFFSIGFSRYYLPFSRNYTIIRSTTIINNVYYRNNYRCVAGPWASDIGRYYRGRIQVYNIHHAGRAGRTVIRNNTVNIYRPSVNRRGDNRPGRFVNRDTYRSNRQGQALNSRNGRSNNSSYFNGNRSADRRRETPARGSDDRRRQFEQNRVADRRNNNAGNRNDRTDRRNDNNSGNNRNDDFFRRNNTNRAGNDNGRQRTYDNRNNDNGRQRTYDNRNSDNGRQREYNNPNTQRSSDRPVADRSRTNRSRQGNSPAPGREFNQRNRTTERQFGNSGQQRNSSRREYTLQNNNRSRDTQRSNSGMSGSSRSSGSSQSGNSAGSGRGNGGNSQSGHSRRGHGN